MTAPPTISAAVATPRPPAVRPGAGAPLTGPAARRARRRGPLPAAVPHLLALVAGLALWGVAVGRADADTMGEVGLVGVLGPLWYAGLALIVGSFAAALWRDRAVAGWVLGAHIAGLVLVIHGTTPLLYDAPRYAWTYKHLAVTDLIAVTGHVDRSIDIYNNWPGFFAVTAWLQRLGGVPMIDVAGWAMVFFGLVTVASVHYAAGGLTEDRRTRWLVSLLFVLGSWVGTEYFSPQAYAFVLCFTFIGVVLRATAPRRPSRRVAGLLARSMGVPQTAVRLGEELPARLAGVPAIILGGTLYLATVVSHQLSPGLLIAAVCGLFVVRRLPIWVPLAMIAVEVAWIVTAYDYLSSKFQLLDARGIQTPEPDALAASVPEAGVAWASNGSRAVLAILALSAAAGFLRSLRRGRIEASAVALIVVPGLILPLQAYGGEGAFRAYIFSLPWLALLAGPVLLAPRTGPRWVRVRRGVLAGGAIAVIAGAFVLAYFGLERANRITKEDVAIARAFEEVADPRGAVAFVAAPNLPSPQTARYPAITMPPSAASVVLTAADLKGIESGRRAVSLIEQLAANRPEPGVYVLLSGSERRYAELYGLLSPGALGRLDRALGAAPTFKLVRRIGEGVLYQYTGPRYTP